MRVQVTLTVNKEITLEDVEDYFENREEFDPSDDDFKEFLRDCLDDDIASLGVTYDMIVDACKINEDDKRTVKENLAQLQADLQADEEQMDHEDQDDTEDKA